MISSGEKDGVVLYSSDNHKVLWLGVDSEEEKGVIQANQFLIINNGKGIILDPGGVHLFARVVAVVSRYIDIKDISAIVYSHQDPDVSSGIALWMGITDATVYISSLWTRFIPHFGIVDNSRIKGVDGSSYSVSLPSGVSLKFIPSHFLHSAGCYSFFDEKSRILFSGDIGASVFNSSLEYIMVEDFNEHIAKIDAFHKRYMSSGKVLKKWVSVVREISPEMIAPQHGAIYKGETAVKFLKWLSDLECGIDLIDEIYR